MRTKTRKQYEQEQRKAFAEAIVKEKRTQSDARGYVQCMNAATLALASRGMIDLNALAIDELAARGLDSNGEWVGFQKARELAQAAKDELSMHGYIRQGKA